MSLPFGYNKFKPIWVLTYLIDQDSWWPHSAPHTPNFFADVHTYCFETEAEANEHWIALGAGKSGYRVKKTYLQTVEDKS